MNAMPIMVVITPNPMVTSINENPFSLLANFITPSTPGNDERDADTIGQARRRIDLYHFYRDSSHVARCSRTCQNLPTHVQGSGRCVCNRRAVASVGRV